MKVLLFVTVMVALSVASNHRGPMCYDGCSTVNKATYDGYDKMNEFDNSPQDIFKRCTSYFIKYCKVGETCNSITGLIKVDIEESAATKKGEMEVKHTRCGPSNEDKETFCDVMKKVANEEIEKWRNYPTNDNKYTLKKVESVECQATFNACDGKTTKCVDLKYHPEWKELPAEDPEKDPHEKMSQGSVPKICSLLLAYPFLAHMN